MNAADSTNVIINLSTFQLFLAFLIPLFIILISKSSNLGKEKDILKTSIKMMIQLLILGYILVFLLKILPPILGTSYVFVMLFFAIRTLKKRMEGNKFHFKNGAIAMSAGSLFLLFYFIIVVINPNPIINPQYIIPMYGMILGNTLTGMTLGINTFSETIKTEKEYISTLTNLGVNPNIAIKKVFQKTMNVAITPTLTGMSAMGLVSLPGMMTGQILSGTDPIIAVKYQIAIMLSIFGSVFLTNFIFLYLTKKSLINKYDQIVEIGEL